MVPTVLTAILVMNEGVYDGAIFTIELTAAITSVASNDVRASHIRATNRLGISMPATPYACVKISSDLEIPVINSYGISCTGGHHSGGELESINDSIQNFMAHSPSSVYAFI